MSKELKQVIVKSITKLAKSEVTVKQELSGLSTTLLRYVPDTQDIAMVNRLLNACTPMNKKACIAYFTHFLEWTFDKEKGEFTTKFKGDKKILRKVIARREFLKDVNNDLWSWSTEHLKVEKQKPNYTNRIKSNISKAIADEENGLTQAEVVRAVIEGGIDLNSLIALAGNLAKEIKEAGLAIEQEEQLKGLEKVA